MRAPDKTNALVVVGVGILGAGAIGMEGYELRLGPGLVLFAAIAMGMAVYGSALLLSRKRVLACIATAGIAGLVTQAVGTNLGAWSYPRPTYAFVAPAFAVGSLAILTLAIRLVRRLPDRLPWAIAPIGIAVLLAIVVGGVLSTEPSFLAWYGFLVGVAGVAFRRAPATVVAVSIVAASFGAVAETVGAQAGLWSFRGPLPPAWLPLGSWPLESLMHVAVSAWLAGEPVALLTGPRAAASAMGAPGDAGTRS